MNLKHCDSPFRAALLKNKRNIARFQRIKHTGRTAAPAAGTGAGNYFHASW